jgi:hypothetical protein
VAITLPKSVRRDGPVTKCVTVTTHGVSLLFRTLDLDPRLRRVLSLCVFTDLGSSAFL